MATAIVFAQRSNQLASPGKGHGAVPGTSEFHDKSSWNVTGIVLVFLVLFS